MLKTLLGVVFWIVVALWIVHHPAEADTDIRNVGTFLSGLVG